uniref:SWIM-type domain-containing protein n=1 Tax=Clastoptera arizonana TaxID=38151 RepID=A0A1B6EFH2_9HEMI
MQKEERIKSLFQDIGKSTLRGVRKCPKCGTSNGMRGFCCKNRACDVVFKEAGEKRKQSTDVCKLATSSNTQVFSVRVRDKGPDYRGFVQLPLLPSLSVGLVNEASALCFVDSCQRAFNTNVLKCHEKESSVDATCQHIQATMRCYAEAQPLLINNSVLYSLNFSLEVKEAVWQLVLETVGPLVQRVSKTVMVVKCKVTSKQPLGYLHVSFPGNQTHYSCTCPSYKGVPKITKNMGRCFHYYPCIAAFASDEKLSEEFAHFVDQDRQTLHIMRSKTDEVISEINGENSQNQLVAILSDVVNNCEVKIEVLREEAELLNQYSLSDGITQAEEFDTISATEITAENISELDMESLEVVYPESEITTLIINQDSFEEGEVLKNNTEKKTTPNVEVSEKRVNTKKKKDDAAQPQTTRSENASKRPRKPNNNQPKPSPVKKDGIDESIVNQSFINWLSSVTERINQTMHFQFSGKPASLVFHTPQEFFDCLRERISAGGFKRRLPNTTTAFMPLDITRSFIENKDGSYEPYVATNVQEEAFSKLENGPRIRPLELKTYLKVGRTTPDQKTPTPLIIEWIPDILPVSKVGELKITFEYGHRRP